MHYVRSKVTHRPKYSLSLNKIDVSLKSIIAAILFGSVHFQIPIIKSDKKKSKYICHDKPYFGTEAVTDTFPKRDRTRSAYKKSQSVIDNRHLKSLSSLTHPVMQTTTIQMTDEPKFSKSKISNHRLKGKNIVCYKIRHLNFFFGASSSSAKTIASSKQFFNPF